MNSITAPKMADAKGTIELARIEQGVNQAESLAKKSVKEQKDLEKAAAGFEALMLQEMLKSMWATVDTTGLLGEDSNQAQIYRDMMNQAIADNTAEGRGIGVKAFLKNELEKYAKASKS